MKGYGGEGGRAVVTLNLKWMLISMHGRTKCTAQKLSKAHFYKKELIQHTWGELQCS
jgi:hypothetical protein